MISDQALVDETIRLVREEREILTAILHHLKEIEKRRLFCLYKCPSLFEFAVQILKYSEPQAQRRISAMRLLRDLPEIENKITDGSLSLTHLNLAQNLFSKQKKAGKAYDMSEKTQILQDMENTTKREAEKIIYAKAPELKPKGLDFNMITDDSLREKLLKLKGQYAHTHPDISLNELLHLLCDQALSPAKKKTQLERQVWERDQSRCTNCHSTYAIQSDHRIPHAKGGPTTVENMRLLCRKCNQRAAIVHFGQQKMARYVP